jgi:hypothetical protein
MQSLDIILGEMPMMRMSSRMVRHSFYLGRIISIFIGEEEEYYEEEGEEAEQQKG